MQGGALVVMVTRVRNPGCQFVDMQMEVLVIYWSFIYVVDWRYWSGVWPS